MATIPQRELRNDIADVLRRAEEGEHIVVTVSGRPVAQLGPVARPTFVAGAVAREVLERLPKTSGLLDDIRLAGGDLVDPFA